MSPRDSLHASWQRPACTRLSNRAMLLHCICRLLAHRDASLRRTDWVVIGGIADIPGAPRTSGCEATDPQPTKAPSKSRSAVGLPQCYLPLRSTGEIAGETARLHHAPRRRRGCVAARGARAAAGDAANVILSAVGYNLRLVLAWLRIILRELALLQTFTIRPALKPAS
jgi:hypothetical protein